MKKLKLIILLIFLITVANTFSKLLLLYFSKPSSPAFNIMDIKLEKRDNPPYKWVLGDDMLPHIKLFFWVPVDSKNYTAFADKAIKTFVLRHGTVDKWGVGETGETSKNEKLVYVYVPKTFILLYGKDFYNLIHLYYK